MCYMNLIFVKASFRKYRSKEGTSKLLANNFWWLKCEVASFCEFKASLLQKVAMFAERLQLAVNICEHYLFLPANCSVRDFLWYFQAFRHKRFKTSVKTNHGEERQKSIKIWVFWHQKARSFCHLLTVLWNDFYP